MPPLLAEQPQKDAVVTVKEVSLSPYEIQRVVNNNRIKWEKFKISEPVDLKPFWNTLGIESDGEGAIFNVCESSCEAHTFNLQLDDNPDREVLLKITKSFNFCRFLLFKKMSSHHDKNNRWKFLGYIDHENRYALARHTVVHSNSKHWLIIRGQTGSGTGYAAYADTWYEVSEKGIKSVLEYPAEVEENPFPEGLSRELRTKVAHHQASQKPLTMVVEFSMSYKGLDDMIGVYPYLFSKRQRVFFRWDSKVKKFVFDEVHSK